MLKMVRPKRIIVPSSTYDTLSEDRAWYYSAILTGIPKKEELAKPIIYCKIRCQREFIYVHLVHTVATNELQINGH